jgi:hypothetical protein
MIGSVWSHVTMGALTGATADGRRQGQALSDGGSPVQGRSRSGVTAALRSVAKPDHTLIPGGEAVNLTLSPTALAGEVGLDDLVALLKGYVGLGGEQVQVNVLALTALTRALLPRMIAQKRGAILNVSSSAGFLPVSGFAVYAATKAYVTSFSEAVRAETRGCGITITTLCPGPVHTEFADVANRQEHPGKRRNSLVHVPVEKVASAGLEAIERDKPLVTVRQ